MGMSTNQTEVRNPNRARGWSAISVAESIQEGLVAQSVLAHNLEEGRHEIVYVSHTPFGRVWDEPNGRQGLGE